MVNRDEYVQKLKAQIDLWNAEAARWEQKAKEAQAGMKAEYERQLAQVQSRRDEMLYQLRLLQNASADAFGDMMRGAEQAWKSMAEAFDSARRHFEKK
jgi:lipid II:glycine glycyltransferase (peptidoglycan interpeptide bridge formation enzyme)